ncbi:hypothetical protein EIP86_000138 [Pleurotus ostreatoroseus]|nr:hypothetical protein EIP86_000138 [Pleurotus ostreatoroseus]
MRSSSRLATVLAGAALLATGANALPKVTRSGRYLYNEDGSRFFIKGVAYQQQGAESTDPNNPFLEPSTFIDSLADGAGCQRDIPFLQELDVNVIRAYSVDSTLDHDTCMNALSAANIYTIIDLSLPTNGSIDRLDPAWTTDLLDLYLNTINVFSKYDNVLGYNVGNEIVTQANGTAAAAFIKAAARDVKAYLNSKNINALIGYAAIDADDSWLVPFANYLSCDPSNTNSDATAIDLFGLNNYEFCGDASASAYSDKNGAFAGYNVAAYFSEFGCITSPPRLWTEVPIIFSEPMSDIWSGGIAFSYFPATSSQGQFGMVTISSDNTTVTVSDDFTRLQAQFNSTTGPNTPSAPGTTTFPSCPTTNSTFLASSTLPPTPNDNSCNCLEDSLACTFAPKTSNTTGILGPLLDTTCGLLGQAGGNCDAISADGASGTYGTVSGCSPSIKLSYVMDQYYELTNRVATSCDFGGNATINVNAPTGTAASAAASSCLSNPNATFVPSAPSTTAGSGAAATGSGSSSSGSNSGSGTSGSNGNSASGAVGREAFVGALIATACGLVGGLLALA